MDLKEENVISILEEDAWSSSNNLKMKSIVNVDDFVKDYDFSTINSELNNELCNVFTESSSDSICIMMDKKKQDVNVQMINLDSDILKLVLVGAEDSISCLSFQCDSKNNKELLKLQSEENMLALNNLCNTRNLPNILRAPKTFSKRDTFSFPFEMEDNFYYTNAVLENNIFVEECTKNIEKSHRKRKQRHDPLIIKEESINWVINSTSDCDDNSKKKRKFNSSKAAGLNCSNKRKKKCEKKSFLMKKVNGKQSVNKASKKSNITSDSTVSILEQDKEKSNDLGISLDFITFHEEQIHEDYIDHFDILTDIIKEQQVFNDNCYDINSNTIYNSNILDSEKLECQKSLKHNVVDQVENSCENKDIISKNNSSSDCKECFRHKSKNCFIFEEYSETRYINNYFSSYFNDPLDNSSDGSFCRKHSMSNCLQNSLSKDKTEHMNNLLLKDEKKYQAYLESKLNDDLTSSNINYLLTDTNKSITHGCLSNNLEDSTIVKQKSNTQQSIQFDVLLDTDLSTKVSSDSEDISLTDLLENNIRLEEVIQEKKKMSNKYMIVHKLNEELEIKCDYKEKSDKEILMENNNSNRIKKKDIKETVISLVKSTCTQQIFKFIFLQNEPLCGQNLFYIYELVFNVESLSTHLFHWLQNILYISLKNSSILHATKNIYSLQCLLCPLIFPSEHSLALHVAGTHGDMYMILCERCGRIFNKKCVFNNHFIYCGCIKLPFSCNKCNKSYRHKSSLIYHLKIAHKIDYKYDKTKEYKCDICSKTYRKYGAFEKHLSIHINSTKSLNLRDKNCTLIVTV